MPNIPDSPRARARRRIQQKRRMAQRARQLITVMEDTDRPATQRLNAVVQAVAYLLRQDLKDDLE